MRILFILENYYPAIGGVETLFKSLIDALSARGIECIILTTKLHDLPKKQQENGVTVIRYNYLSRYLFTFLALFPALRYGRTVDFIHTTSYNAGLPASIAGILLRKKVIITFHEVWGKLWFRLPFFNRLSKLLHYLFEQMLLRLPFYKFVAVSEFTASRLLKHGISPNKIRTIYNGIEYDRWKPLGTATSDQFFDFIYYGRLGISKGLDLLVPAFDMIAKNNEQVRLHLVLPYKPKNQLNTIKEFIQSSTHAAQIKVYHELKHDALIELICQSDCVVIPSYSEGFGYIAVESMALGKPIVSSGRGALKEVVGGNVIEMSEHSVEGLAKAMTSAIENDWEYRDERKFILEETVSQYVNMYNTLSHV